MSGLAMMETAVAARRDWPATRHPATGAEPEPTVRGGSRREGSYPAKVGAVSQVHVTRRGGKAPAPYPVRDAEAMMAHSGAERALRE